jgi:hypothetical protein
MFAENLNHVGDSTGNDAHRFQPRRRAELDSRGLIARREP